MTEKHIKTPSLEQLKTRRDEYKERLDVGVLKIEEARGQGKDVTEWESYWIELLRRWEAICDKIRDLEAGAGA